MTFGVLLTVYVVGYLSGLASCLLWDLIQHFKRN